METISTTSGSKPGAPRCCQPSILSMTATDPPHLGAWHQFAVRAGDNPPRRSWTYWRRASFAAFGRQPRRSVCAVVARYQGEIVEDPVAGDSRTPHWRASASLLEQKTDGSRAEPTRTNRRRHTSRHPGLLADNPPAIYRSRCSRRQPGGRPGDRIGPQRTISPTNLPRFHRNSSLSKLRRPFESYP